MPLDAGVVFTVFAYLVEMLIIWIAILLSSRILASGVSMKRAFIIAFLAYFLPPLVLSFIAPSIPFAFIIIPLLVWIILGELLLRESTFMGRIKISVVAFVFYLILTFLSIPALIIGLVA